MAQTIWSGSITFGLVSVPVSLHSATRDHTVHFHQVQRGTSDRIRYRKVNERTGEEVDADDIVKGREVDGDFVVVEPDELDSVAPGRSQNLDIQTFVDIADIDPVYFDKTYWLGPGRKGDTKPYALLVKAMAETDRAGIGSFVMRGKEYLAAIRAHEGLLALDTLFFADEVLDPGEQVSEVPSLRAAKGKELDMAVSLVESMSDSWDPGDYRDTYTDRVEQLLEDKRKGREVTAEPEPAAEADVVDLADVLRRSVDEARKGRTQGRSRSRGSGRAATPDLSELTKAELGEMARELDIRGRSSMTRAELEKAVRSAGGSSEQTKAS
jgi:DNA end-binding protein Ku